MYSRKEFGGNYNPNVDFVLENRTKNSVEFGKMVDRDKHKISLK